MILKEYIIINDDSKFYCDYLNLVDCDLSVHGIKFKVSWTPGIRDLSNIITYCVNSSYYRAVLYIKENAITITFYQNESVNLFLSNVEKIECEKVRNDLREFLYPYNSYLSLMFL